MFFFFLILFWSQVFKISRIREKEVPHSGAGKKHLIQVRCPRQDCSGCCALEESCPSMSGLWAVQAEADLRTTINAGLSKAQVVVGMGNPLSDPLAVSPILKDF